MAMYSSLPVYQPVNAGIYNPYAASYPASYPTPLAHGAPAHHHAQLTGEKIHDGNRINHTDLLMYVDASDSVSVVLTTQHSAKGPMLTVRVGDAVSDTTHAERTYYVHQHLIATRSELFKRTTNGKWREAEKMIIRFPKDSPAVFEIYLGLIYMGKLATKNCAENDSTIYEYTVLARLYVFADKLMDTQAKNMIAEAILVLSREPTTSPYGPSDAARIIYKRTSESSPARRLFVDIFADHGGSWLPARGADDAANVPPEFLYDLSVRLMELKQNPRCCPPTTTCPLTEYHEVERSPLLRVLTVRDG
jgi:hypothetical protein